MSTGDEFMLFGVRVRVDHMRKSVSLNDLSQYEVVSSAAAADVPAAAAAASDVPAVVVDGYVSADDVVVRKSSGGGRVRKRAAASVRSDPSPLDVLFNTIVGVSWTEEEHKLFLLGLQKVGKGDWRGISRNFVKTRTPTQVASHAQKYFLRRSNLNCRRRRSSLFDITTDSVTPITMEEIVHKEHKSRPLLPPAQLPLPETSILSGPQVMHFPLTMYPISVPVQIDTQVEKFNYGHVGHINHNDSAEIVNTVPILPVPTQTRMVDFNLNQGFSEDPLSLNLSLSLDRVQDQFSRGSAFEVMSSFRNADSMIRVT